MGGRIVQLVQGEKLKLAFDDFDYWIERFAKYPLVQLIDLDAAMRQGENTALIEMICKRLPCQVGGGLKTAEDGRRLLDAGAKRVIYGSSLFSPAHDDEAVVNGAPKARRHKIIDLEFAAGLKSALGEDALCFSVDTKNGKVAVKGWKDSSQPDAGGGHYVARGFLCGVSLHARGYRGHDAGLSDGRGGDPAVDDGEATHRCRRDSRTR
jgi:phosphoribosylformimino-5-aminoimidazole carboxamide ribotide isomerase